MDERHVPYKGLYPNQPDSSCMCPTDPDLLLLRKNAIGERMAIYFYLCAAEQTSGELCKLFTEIAQDEMVHFRRTMTVLACLDPVQNCAFNDVEINLPSIDSFRKSNKNCCNFEVLELLTQAINNELAAINQYQESYTCAKNKDVKVLFCDNANDEKVHLAELWKAIMLCTNENTVKA
ncbi:hypothetical protein [Anaerosinus massiliensis]|uniref:hypothetical protein n=1 Tax=Massilibacillus massiliensis TaxID=1806837 RepID=UPI000DA64041|nr:hypothetical protein [Massilibacillus massiliensis]